MLTLVLVLAAVAYLAIGVVCCLIASVGRQSLLGYLACLFLWPIILVPLLISYLFQT